MPKKQCGICGRQIKGDYHWMTDERNKAVMVCKEDRECYAKLRQLSKKGEKNRERISS